MEKYNYQVVGFIGMGGNHKTFKFEKSKKVIAKAKELKKEGYRNISIHLID